jgi:protein TonB
MERPSHIVFDTYPHSNTSRRLPILGLALGLQVAGLWLFTYGLMSVLIPIAHGPIVLVPVPEKKTDDRVKPPDPVWLKPKPVTMDAPRLIVDRDPGGTAIHAEDGSGQATTTNPPLPQDRPLLSITSTHTVPPYPPIARRIGAEGKVTLRLTVSAEGRVTQAQIVTSSGRADLDEAAQQWILAHWLYKPALGALAVSHTLASVTFSLVNTP